MCKVVSRNINVFLLLLHGIVAYYIYCPRLFSLLMGRDTIYPEKERCSGEWEQHKQNYEGGI